MKGCGVYMVENPLGEIYIGSSLNLADRYKGYKNIYSRRPIDESIRKYGVEKHKFTVLEYHDGKDVMKLRELEDFYIAYIESLGFNLLNVCGTKKAKGYKNATPRRKGEKIRKLICINGDTLSKLKILAKKDGRNLKNYIEYILEEEAYK